MLFNFDVKMGLSEAQRNTPMAVKNIRAGGYRKGS
jgi:hypothetical protein